MNWCSNALHFNYDLGCAAKLGAVKWWGGVVLRLWCSAIWSTGGEAA